MRVELARAWPRRHELRAVELPEGATVADALRAAGWSTGVEGAVAVFGVVADAATVLHEGDRVELLRPLVVDPREARRRRAGGRMR
ncbi:RnfH family protein [Lysobacter sp. GX 14042]|uniref:RnfH family protein n=1 Tax=Lysobacter sp. GX 14042 TaxID=2907155 RepID=UPI001F1C111F|nr:RnfH family protein [Lysobacter sp. GX 14042]MCE7031307.1 RnfH family protein [Lysobacter sp. GX 14042]